MAIRHPLILALLVAVLTATGSAQPPAEPTIAAVTAREPANLRAWRLLGVAYQNGKELDKALAAYGKALEIQPDAAQTLYNVGTAYALKQDANAAFEWLGKAKATRKLDMTQIENAATTMPIPATASQP